MSKDEQGIEKEIQAKKLNAPRLNPAHIDAQIIGEMYLTPTGRDKAITVSAEVGPLVQESLQCVTICILVLQNGFTVVGTSACTSPQNFDAEIGRKIAREDARDAIWRLEGYALRNRLHESTKQDAERNIQDS